MHPFLIAPLLMLAACTAPVPDVTVERPPPGTAVIHISAGTSEWGFSATEVHADDRVISIDSAGIGQPQRERAQTIPGAYARVAATLRREGPAAVRATGPHPGICPGSQDVVAANPPVGGFSLLTAPCGGDDAPFRTLHGAALGAIVPPR